MTNLDGAESLRRARDALGSIRAESLDQDQRIAYAAAHAATAAASAVARGFVELGIRVNSLIDAVEGE